LELSELLVTTLAVHGLPASISEPIAAESLNEVSFGLHSILMLTDEHLYPQHFGIHDDKKIFCHVASLAGRIRYG
jgi:hypothetical protein